MRLQLLDGCSAMRSSTTMHSKSGMVWSSVPELTARISKGSPVECGE